jgi:hypothetical protein
MIVLVVVLGIVIEPGETEDEDDDDNALSPCFR